MATLVFLPKNAHAMQARQKAANDTIRVISSYNNYLYAGIDNYIEINPKLLPYKNILIEVEKGMAMPDNGNYMIMVGKPGTTVISIYQYDKGDTLLVYKKAMTVKAVPAPYVTFNGVKLEELEYINKKQLNVTAEFKVEVSEDIIDDEDWFTIKTITVGYPYGQQYVTKTCNGPRLTKEIIDDLTMLSPGKEIAFAFTLTASGDVYKRIQPVRIKLY